jgi:hypothetical protein
MRNVLIFGGLAIVGYALYNKFGKDLFTEKSEPINPITETPTATTGIVLMGDIDKTKPSVIESAVVRKKGKFTPNRPIGRPRKSSIDLPKGNCQCIKAPCNC